jgi:hypothetical protein
MENENTIAPDVPVARCRNCGKPYLVSRQGRIFCCDECRSAWHNRRKKPSERYRQRVSGALERNYRMLSILLERGVDRVCMHDPFLAGFRTDYMTSCVRAGRKRTLYYCFDIRYRMAEDVIYGIEKIPGLETVAGDGCRVNDSV